MTKLGIALRKIRLDKQALLRDMAAKLNGSSVFLSAVETGKSVPLQILLTGFVTHMS